MTHLAFRKKSFDDPYGISDERKEELNILFENVFRQEYDMLHKMKHPAEHLISIVSLSAIDVNELIYLHALIVDNMHLKGYYSKRVVALL